MLLIRNRGGHGGSKFQREAKNATDWETEKIDLKEISQVGKGARQASGQEPFKFQSAAAPAQD